MAPSSFFVFCTWVVLLVMIHTSLAKPLCHQDESSALMEFKLSLRIDRTMCNCAHPKAESWSLDRSEDCCSWDGVECDEASGHVTGLDLGNSCLFGNISSNTSLFRLLHLKSLDLSWNCFNFSPMPYGFGNLSRLQYLSLSNSHFSGKVPSDISRLSELISLDLSSLSFYGQLEMPNIDNFFHNLTMLREINLSFISMTSQFPRVLANFSSLKSLKFVECDLHGEFPASIFQLPNLEVLDISSNFDLSGFIPELHWGSPLKSLDLQGTNFLGEIPVSIGRLIFLNELTIRVCNFSGLLPSSLGNLSQLAHLDMSHNKFHGPIPVSFTNLTQLFFLDLSFNNFTGDTWHRLFKLSKLTTLILSGVQLSGPIPSSFESLTQLVALDLSNNNLEGEISFENLTRLEYLDLSNNYLERGISFKSLPQLVDLDLSDNYLKGEISFENLTRLAYLHLSNNYLKGEPSFENLMRLVSLDLSDNYLEGDIPNSLSELKDLQNLNLCRNNLSVIVDLHKLKNLTWLYLDSNNISFISRTETNATLPRLSTLSLRSCNLQEFPKFLAYISGLETMDLSNNKIRGSIPTWMGNGSRESLEWVDLSHNFLTHFENKHINLQVPKLRYLDISSNSLKMEFPTPPPSMKYCDISNNNLFGEIQSICRAKSLIFLDLSNNSLNGTIPSCVGKIVSLSILKLGKNKFEGMIPHAYQQGCALKIMNLTENRLQGPIPRSLAHCTMLEYLNLGYNQIVDGFPLWLSKLTELKFVILKSNKFHGPIEIHGRQFKFSNMHIMDLSHNGFSGELPSKLLQSFHAMKGIGSQNQFDYYLFDGGDVGYIGGDNGEYLRSYFVQFAMKLMNKGTEREYSKVWNAFMVVDLSHNKFEGCLPNVIGDLKSLIFLNLSNNVLIGPIPPSLANLTNLESLDLSRNNLSGEIPTQLAQLTFLSYFDVSHNQLWGPIPRGTQFSTFPIDSFVVNEGLCGSPLPNKCPGTGDTLPSPPSPGEEIGEDSPFVLDWKFVLIGAGVGFLIGVVLGNLIIDEKSGWFLHYSKRMARRWKRSGRH